MIYIHKLCMEFNELYWRKWHWNQLSAAIALRGLWPDIKARAIGWLPQCHADQWWKGKEVLKIKFNFPVHIMKCSLLRNYWCVRPWEMRQESDGIRWPNPHWIAKGPAAIPSWHREPGTIVSLNNDIKSWHLYSSVHVKSPNFTNYCRLLLSHWNAPTSGVKQGSCLTVRGSPGPKFRRRREE